MARRLVMVSLHIEEDPPNQPVGDGTLMAAGCKTLIDAGLHPSVCSDYRYFVDSPVNAQSSLEKLAELGVPCFLHSHGSPSYRDLTESVQILERWGIPWYRVFEGLGSDAELEIARQWAGQNFRGEDWAQVGFPGFVGCARVKTGASGIVQSPNSRIVACGSGVLTTVAGSTWNGLAAAYPEPISTWRIGIDPNTMLTIPGGQTMAVLAAWYATMQAAGAEPATTWEVLQAWLATGGVPSVRPYP